MRPGEMESAPAGLPSGAEDRAMQEPEGTAAATATGGEAPSPYLALVRFAVAFRRTALLLLFITLAATLLFYAISPQLFRLLQGHLHQRLAFFAVAEPFLAHVKLALAAALFVLMPLYLFSLWRALARPFRLSPLHLALFTLCTCLLFYGGASFCYFITLPYGIDFLLGYATSQLRPVIAIGRFVSFVCLFVLAFGIIFELPVFMLFAARAGICPRSTFERSRRYAVLVISIVAALLTPTPDVVNMLLMGAPLYLLYEAGILAMRLFRI